MELMNAVKANEKRRLVAPAVDLVIEEKADYLIVRQGNEVYRATGWQLTDAVMAVIRTALQHGLTCLIRQRHPQVCNRNRGVKYLGFSRSPEERWVFVLDQYSKLKRLPGVIRQVTFENRFSSVLLHLDGVQTEMGGGRNLFVPFTEFENALAIAVQHL